jgi:hypothetical protein
MDGYVRKKPTFWFRMRTSPLFYGFILVITASLVYFFAGTHSENAPEIKPSALASPTPQPLKALVAAAPVAPPVLPDESSEETSVVATELSTTTTATETDQTLSKILSSEPTSVRIEFAVLNREALEKISQDGEGHLELGRYSMATLPHFHSHYGQASLIKGFQSLSSESRSLLNGQPSLVFRGGKEPKSGETIGFFIEVTPLKKVERGYDFKISVKRSLPEENATGDQRVNSQSFEETMTIPQGGAVAFSGILPHHELAPNEDELYKNNILKVFLDPTFRSGDSDLFLLIHPSRTGEDSE